MMGFKMIIVVPDAHVDLKQNLIRFKALGNYIVEKKPEAVVILGDFGTFDSVNSHENRDTIKGAKLPTIAEDFEACKKAISLLIEPLLKLQAKQKRNKEKIYKPNLIMTFGNHEFRVDRFINKNPAFEHLIDISKSMGLTDPNIVGINIFEICEYKKYYKYGDFVFTHVPIDGAGKPIASMMAASRILGRSKHHVVYGHTHKFSISNLPLLGNENEVIYAIEAGSFLNQDHIESYAEGFNTGWSYNILELESNGPCKTPNINLVTVERLLKYA